MAGTIRPTGLRVFPVREQNEDWAHNENRFRALVQQAFDTTQLNLGVLQREIQRMGGSSSDLLPRVEQLEQGQASLQSSLGILADRVTDVETVNATQTSDISALTTRVTNVESVNSSQGSSISNLLTRMSSVESVNTTQTSDISALTTRVTNVEGVNATQSTDIGALDTRVTAVEGVNSTQNTNISNLTSDLTSLTTRVSSVESVNSTQNTNITNLTTRVSSVESVNSTQNTNITNLTTRVTNVENVNTSQASSITNLISSVNSVSSRVSVLENTPAVVFQAFSNQDSAVVSSSLVTFDYSNVDQNTSLINIQGDEFEIASSANGMIVMISCALTIRYSNRSQLDVRLEYRTASGSWQNVVGNFSNYATRNSTFNEGSVTLPVYSRRVSTGDRFRVRYQIFREGTDTPTFVSGRSCWLSATLFPL